MTINQNFFDCIETYLQNQINRYLKYDNLYNNMKPDQIEDNKETIINRVDAGLRLLETLKCITIIEGEHKAKDLARKFINEQINHIKGKRGKIINLISKYGPLNDSKSNLINEVASYDERNSAMELGFLEDLIKQY